MARHGGIDVNEPDNWSTWSALGAHIDALADLAEQLGINDRRLGALLDRLATFRELRGHVLLAMATFERAIGALIRSDAPKYSVLQARCNAAQAIANVDQAEAEARLIELRAELIDDAGWEEAQRSMLLATISQALGLIARNTGRGLEAEAMFDEALGIYSRVLPEVEWYRSKAICDCLNNLGLVALDRGELELAIRRFDQAADLNRRGGRDLEVARCTSNSGVAHYHAGRFEAAEAAHRAALDIRSGLLGDHHPLTTLSRGELAATLRGRAGALDRNEALAEIVVLLKQAIALDTESLALLDNGDDSNGARAARLNGLGVSYLDLYKLTRRDQDACQSRQAFDASLSLRLKFDRRDIAAAQTTTNIGMLSLAEQEPRRAKAEFETAMKLLASRGGDPTPTHALAFHGLGQAIADMATNDVERRQALKLFTRSYDLYATLTQPSSPSSRRQLATIRKYQTLWKLSD